MFLKLRFKLVEAEAN